MISEILRKSKKVNTNKKTAIEPLKVRIMPFSVIEHSRCISYRNFIILQTDRKINSFSKKVVRK